MPYFTYTRLNQYLDLLPFIGFLHFAAVWNAKNKSNLIAQFFKEICTDDFEGNLHIFLNTHLGFKILNLFLKICICWVKGFTKVYNLLQFVQFFLHNFYLMTRFCHKYLDFWKFAFFCQIIEVLRSFQKRIKCYRFVSQ